MSTTLRAATLNDLATLLTDEQARKHDMVLPATALSADTDGRLVITGADAIIDADGVTPSDGTYVPTDVAIGSLAEKLGIPTAYLRKLHATRGDLWAANVNGWLLGRSDPTGDFQVTDPDGRSFLVRTFRGDTPGGDGIARAVLSDTYQTIDHLDVLTAALAGIRAAGVDVQVSRCDLTDRRMYVRIAAPSVAVAAPALLANYVSPFTKARGADNPMVHAGFVLSNSETGDGSMSLAPQITVRVCDNGMTMTEDVFRKVHLGARLDHGVVKFSDDTHAAALRLIEGQARDTVATFLDPAYVTRKVEAMTAQAQVPVTGDPAAVVETVTKRLSYTEAQRADVLRMFIAGADLSAGGVMHAVTAAAQEQANADVANAMEADALRSLGYAASAATLTAVA